MKPRRIVSLLPSATEVVCALGLRDQLVGVSHECDHPVDIVGLPILTEPKLGALVDECGDLLPRGASARVSAAGLAT